MKKACDSREKRRRASFVSTRRLWLPAAFLGASAILLSMYFAWGCGGSQGTGKSAPDSQDTVVSDAIAPPADLKQAETAGPGPVLPTETPASPPPGGSLDGAVICIDPGHASTIDAATEPIGPGSAEMKVKDPGGTSGSVTGVREPVVTLAISQYLKQQLEAQGAIVFMTRSGPDYSGGNRERAQVANQAGADLFIRVHADGSSDSSQRGVSTLHPAAIAGWTDDIYEQSRAAAGSVQAAMVAGLGAPDLGTVERSDITGFNWADVPAILVEVGFMSNPDEDLLLNDTVYQQQVAAALASGISAYLG